MENETSSKIETTEEIIAKEREVFKNLSTRKKLEVREYFELCNMLERDDLSANDTQRLVDLTMTIHDLDLSPLCIEEKIFV